MVRIIIVSLLTMLASPSFAQMERDYLYFTQLFRADFSVAAKDNIGILDLNGGRLKQSIPAILNEGFDIAHAPGTDVVWVGEDGAVKAVNIRTGEVERTLPGPLSTGQIELSPSGDILYVAFFGSDRLRAYDTTTGAVLGDVAAARVNVLELSADGTRLYFLTDTFDLDIHVLDASTLEEISRIPLDDDYFSMALSADGSTLALVEPFLDSTFTVVDLATETVTDFRVTNGQAQDLVLSNDGSVAYLATVSNGVNVTDVSTGALLEVIDTTGAITIAISPDGERVFYWSNFEQLNVVDTATNSIVLSLEVPGVGQMVVGTVPPNPQGVVRGMRAGVSRCENAESGVTVTFPSPRQNWTCPLDQLDVLAGDAVQVALQGTVVADRFVYAPSDLNDALYVSSLSTSQIVGRRSLASRPNFVEVDPNGQAVYVADSVGEVFAFDTSSLEILARIPTNGEPRFMRMQPNSRKLWVSNTEEDTLDIIDVEALSVTDTLTIDVAPDAIVFSPGGDTAYVSQSGFDAGMAAIDTTTLNVTNAALPLSPDDAVIGPEGARLYGAVGRTLQIYDFGVGNVIRLVDFGESTGGVAVSPSGNITYISDNTGRVTYFLNTSLTTLATLPISAPTSIAPDSASGFVYVVSRGDNTIRRIAPAAAVEGPPITVGALSVPGSFLGSPVPSVVNVAGRVDNARELDEYTCRNLTSGQVFSVVSPEGALTWDCTAAGLLAAQGDRVRVELRLTSN